MIASETASKKIAALKDANANLLEHVQHLEAENNNPRLEIEKAEPGKRLAEDRLANRSERFSLSRWKNMQATAVIRKNNRERKQSTAKEKDELVVKMRATKTELKQIKHKENAALGQCKELNPERSQKASQE